MPNDVVSSSFLVSRLYILRGRDDYLVYSPVTPAPTLPRSISEVKHSLHLAKAYQIMDRLISTPAADRYNDRCEAENLRNDGNYGYSAWSPVISRILNSAQDSKDIPDKAG